MRYRVQPLATRHPTGVDVLVVGAGPSGLATAVGLTRAGVSVLVVDKHAGISIFPKATGLRTRGLEILRGWGLEDRVRAHEFPLHGRVAISRTLTEPALEHRSWFPEEPVAWRSSPTTYSTAAQDQLEAALLEHTQRLDVEVRFRTELVDFDARTDQVRARLRDLVHGDVYDVDAAFLVAADGAHSPIRRRLGIDTISYGSIGDQVAALFYADLRDRVPDGLSLGHVISHPDAEGLLFPSGPRRWIYNLACETVTGPSPAGWTLQQWADRLKIATGVHDREIRIDRIFAWEWGAAAAETISAGRVFLVGDAAHRSTPAGGTGTSVGISDAHNLAWKLAWVLHGWADVSLLDSYQAERGPIAQWVAARSMEDDEDPAQRLADDLGQTYCSPAISGLEGRTTVPSLDVLDGRPGARAPHVWVDRYGQRRSTLDLFEGRLTVLTGPDATDWRLAASRLRSNGLPLRTLTAERDVSAPDDSLLGRFGIDPSGAVLVRPDGYVAWRSRGVGPAIRLTTAVDTTLAFRAREHADLLAIPC